MARKNLSEELQKRSYDAILVDAMNVSAIQFHSKKTLSYKGNPTGMLYGVMRLVRTLKTSYPGVRIMFLWEGTKSKRKILYSEYKNNRRFKRDMSFIDSLRDVQKALAFTGIEQVSHVGVEADDLAGYFSKRLGRVLMVSNDKDWWQFVRSGKVDVLIGIEVKTQEDLALHLGYPPERICFHKLIKGDSSDNVSGIPRFPSKLAMQVLQECEKPEQILGVVNRLNPKWGKILLDNKDIFERNLKLLVYHDNWIIPSMIETQISKLDSGGLAEFLHTRGITSLSQGWFD
jgi:DNA polymerase-1